MSTQPCVRTPASTMRTTALPSPLTPHLGRSVDTSAGGCRYRCCLRACLRSIRFPLLLTWQTAERSPSCVVSETSLFIFFFFLSSSSSSSPQVPTGDMPRHMQLNCTRFLTDQAFPGDRLIIHGVLTTNVTSSAFGFSSSSSLLPGGSSSRPGLSLPSLPPLPFFSQPSFFFFFAFQKRPSPHVYLCVCTCIPLQIIGLYPNVHV